MSNHLGQQRLEHGKEVLWATMIEQWRDLLNRVSSKCISFEQATKEYRTEFSEKVQQTLGSQSKNEMDPRVLMLWSMVHPKSTKIMTSNGPYIRWVIQNPLRDDISRRNGLRSQLNQAIEDVDILRHTLKRLSWFRRVRQKSQIEFQIQEHSRRVGHLTDQLSKQQIKIERMMGFWTGGVIERFIDELIPITASAFMMGALVEDQHSYNSEHPFHIVTLTQDFLMGKYPVTQGLWQRVMDNNPSRFKDDNRPFESVSWFDALEFCNKLSELEGFELVYTIKGTHVVCNWNAKGYRIPTEQEWEYCARANESFKYSGGDILSEVGWYDGNSGDETHPVGLKKPNGFGLYDMSGNVYEWVWDSYGSYSSDNQTDLSGPFGGSTRTRRGGGWCSIDRDTRVSFRDGVSPVGCGDFLGFRIMRMV